MKTTTLQFKHSMNLPPARLAFLLIPLALACFALAPQARAACQEGCLTNQNTVLGDDALLNGGFQNTAIGFNALSSNTTGGNNNTGIGYKALVSNTSGISNTAIGYEAMFDNTTGSFNTALGLYALLQNTIGEENTAIGIDALFNNTTGDRNTAVGNGALFNLTTGDRNIAIGYVTGSNLVTGSNNIYIGYAGTVFGNRGNHGESGQIRIGTYGYQTDAFIAGVSGVTIPAGVAVMIDANGHLGTVVSSERFKEAIKPMDKASEAILVLRPVTFRYKHELDPDGIPQFGLVAEDVEKVNPDLVARDADGKAYTVRYEAVNAMLLNEFLKEHKKVEQLQVTVAQQQKDFQAAIATLRQTVTAELNRQAAQMQKLSATLEPNKPVLQTIANNQ
jgi:hypothetical protein